MQVGAESTGVPWLAGNLLSVPRVNAWLEVWHDRAVLHFTTEVTDRMRAALHRTSCTVRTERTPSWSPVNERNM